MVEGRPTAVETEILAHLAISSCGTADVPTLCFASKLDEAEVVESLQRLLR